MDNQERVEIEKKIARSATLQKLFAGKDGKFFLEEIDKVTGYKENTWNPDPYTHAYNAGVRSVAIFLHNVLDQDVENAKKILQEKDK